MVHQAVMYKEAINALNIKPNGIYVDGTFGRGGHTKLILNKIGPNGRLIVIDLDLDAVKVAEQIQKADRRLEVYHGSFSELDYICKKFAINSIDGFLLDLGVSSPQLDKGSRGFSFMKDGPLDMRMNDTNGITARSWLQIVDRSELILVLKKYGQERFAKKIAEAILVSREKNPINTTLELADLIKKIYPKFYVKKKHPATKTFQAIRIFINKELLNLQEALIKSLELLAINGRLVVISFHSLEDTIVKNFIIKNSTSLANNYALRKLPIDVLNLANVKLKNLGKVKPTPQEIKENNRARSAIMRVAERCA